MKVQVEYSAQIRRIACVEDEEVEVDHASTAQDLIRHLASAHGERLARYLFGGDTKLQPTVLAFVNDRQVDWQTPQPLAAGDTVVFLSAIAGGL